MADKEKRKALVIAVSEYENSNLKNLPFCKNDGNEMLSLLKDYGYEIKNVDGLVGRVDGRLMQDIIYSFFEDDAIKSDETLLFYFSGHGVPGKDDFFLSSSNIDPSKPKMRGFSFADLNGEITHCHAKRVVVILDSCYAGSLNVSGKGDESALATAAENKLSATFKEGEGRCLLSSCMGFQESFATAEGEHSFFTNYLLNGLRGAEGKSVDENGIVTPESLMSYIDSEIDNVKGDRPAQTPFRKIEFAGKMMLAAHPELAQATKTKIISEKRSNIRKMLAELLSNGTISERILTGALSVSNLDPLQISGKQKQQWDLLERLLQSDMAVGEFSESWLKLEWEQPQKPPPSEIRIDEKEEAKRNSSELGRFIAQGDSCISNKDYEGAIKWYDKVLEIDPANVYVIGSKGGALVELGRYEEAIKLYDEGLKLVPNNKQGHTWLLNYKQAALERQKSSQKETKKEKNIENVKPEFDKHVEEIPTLQKELEKTKSEKRAGNEQNSSELGKFLYQGDKCFLDKDYEGAIKWYDKALKIEPDHADALNDKGFALANLGRYEDAIEWYDKALKIEPEYAIALNNKGFALYNLGRHKDAIEWYDKALRIDPTNADIQDNKKLAIKKSRPFWRR